MSQPSYSDRWFKHPAFINEYGCAISEQLLMAAAPHEVPDIVMRSLNSDPSVLVIPYAVSRDNHKRQVRVSGPGLRRSQLHVLDEKRATEDAKFMLDRLINQPSVSLNVGSAGAATTQYGGSGGSGYVNLQIGGGGGGGGVTVSPNTNAINRASTAINKMWDAQVNAAMSQGLNAEPALRASDIRAMFATELAAFKDEIIQQVCDELQRIERIMLDRDL
jgi:hypothetical protein